MRMLSMVSSAPIAAVLALSLTVWTSSTTGSSIPLYRHRAVQPPRGPQISPMLPDKFRDEVRTSAIKSNSEETIVEMFHVKSDIRYRFATTQMISRVRNVAGVSKEVHFEVTLPKEAFIMSFNMEIDGKVYDGEVKEKKAAKEQYQAAVDKGQSAGHVRQASRHANIFQVDVSVANGSAVTFTLTYQEILRRKLGKYEHEIHVNPGQTVEDFLIEVVIRESQPLTFVSTPALRTDSLITNEIEAQNELTVIDRPTPEVAHILYDPGLDEQGEGGVTARFAVQYDVEHSKDGEVLMVDGYFLHFFSPDYQPMPKDIVFVLDVSGSMYGEKLSQLKTAMTTILGDLRPEDRFNILTFSSDVYRWREGLVEAYTKNILDALSHVDNMVADGMTNINQALLDATSDLKRRRDQDRVAMIFFLTDGVPTEGEQNSQLIAANVWASNEDTALIFSLAFGSGADYDSLVQISVQNNGFARKIYEASDAALQVSSLYHEISAVAMKDISVDYLPEAVDEFTLTETKFPVIFNGTEIIICGQMAPEAREFQYEISGSKRQGDIEIVLEVDDITNVILNPEAQDEMDDLYSAPRDFGGVVERMWAYLTIKQLLLEKERSVKDEQRVKELTDEILELSIKYKFVTPLTSMVVTKPDDKGEVKETETALTDSDEDDSSMPERGMMHSMTSYSSHKKQGRMRQHRPAVSSLGYDPSVAFDLNGPGFPGLPGLPPDSSQFSATMAPRPATYRTRPPTTTTTRTISTTTTSPNTAIGSLLHLISGRKGTQIVCMAPKAWQVGKYILLETPSGFRISLETECGQRKCKIPNLSKITIERIGNDSKLAEIALDGSTDWARSDSNRNIGGVGIVYTRNKQYGVHIDGAQVDIKRKMKKRTNYYPGSAFMYSFSFSLDSQRTYTGLFGDYMSLSNQELNKLTHKRAGRMCRSLRTDFAVLLKNKQVKTYKNKSRRRGSSRRRNSRRQS